jgi:mono/diheme cytochrome c family protein
LVGILLAAILLLDAGRSILARTGYAQPVERWQPAAARYADIAWPPGADLAAGAPPGARVYAQHCAVCHGPDGRGNGPAAPSLVPRPRDFTLGQFKYTTTAQGQAPSDADLLRVVSDGLAASSMPYWRDVLSEDEMRAVVQYIKSLSSAFSPQVGRPARGALAVPAPLAPSAASVARGRGAYAARGCAGCHGPEGRGGQWLTDAKGDPVITRDLSAPWTFRGGSAPERIWLRITNGVPTGPMPALAADATAQERWDLVNYVRSLARTPPWEDGGQLDGPGERADPLERGRYLVHAQICGLCHTMINATGIYRADDRYLAGGMRVGAYPHATLVSRNLTADMDTGLGRKSEAQIVAALRNGRSDGRVLNVFDMPWVFFHSLHDTDAMAIARYLKSLPPVHDRIPAPLRYGFVETVVAKLGRPLPQAPTTYLTYADQGYGWADERGKPWLSPALLQQALVLAQWLLLGLGALVWIFAGPRPNRAAARVRARFIAAGQLALLGLAGAGAAVLYELPQLTVIPPEQVAGGATVGIFDPAAGGAPGATGQAALLERGRYLFIIGSCALCHGNNASGGAKISWRPLGTLWSRNLTPDPSTGIGAWSDAQIERAIRSGVSRDGHALHWQGMPWDHASNWDEEDIRALIAYLRRLPPVTKLIPADRAPADDDCAVYTFWTTVSTHPGCGS